MNDKYSNVFKVIGIISVVMFVLMGLLTFFVDKYGEEATTEEAEPTKKVSLDGKDNKKKEGEVVVNEPLETDPYEELNELIGLEGVKEEINTLANFVKVQKMRSEKGLKTPKMSYHLVFTGSPGTGKTTVARIVARIYKDLGILKSGHMVETDRSGLVAEYMGQTAVKTNAICDSALNGVLFIDEAYALVPKNDNGADYGQEAISTLLKRMEDDRDKLVVIIAGYPDEMKRFINSNPGLQSRFNRYINFPDYTPEELTMIFMMYVRKNQYTLSDEAKDYLMERLVDIVAKKDRYFGNARYVRNVFEKSIQHQANRLSKSSSAKTEEELKEITLSDLKATI